MRLFKYSSLAAVCLTAMLVCTHASADEWCKGGQTITHGGTWGHNAYNLCEYSDDSWNGQYIKCTCNWCRDTHYQCGTVHARGKWTFSIITCGLTTCVLAMCHVSPYDYRDLDSNKKDCYHNPQP